MIQDIYDYSKTLTLSLYHIVSSKYLAKKAVFFCLKNNVDFGQNYTMLGELWKSAHLVEKCAPCRKVRTLSKSAHLVEKCAPCRKVRTLSKSAHLVEKCAPCRKVRTLSKSAHLVEKSAPFEKTVRIVENVICALVVRTLSKSAHLVEKCPPCRKVRIHCRKVRKFLVENYSCLENLKF